MNINQLRSFVEIVKNNFNITNTAEKLYTSQPTISKQIKFLEEELNVSLFIRKNNTLLALSPIGKQIYQIASNVVGQIEKIKDVVTKEEQAVNLHIATTYTQIRYKLPDVVDKFRVIYPNVSIHFHQGEPTQIADMVKHGEVDFAIGTEFMHFYADLLTLPCYRWTYSVIVPKNHPLEDIECMSIEDLARYPLITYVFGFREHSALNRVFYQSGIIPKVVLTATDAEIIKHYVRLGVGVGVIATAALDDRDLTDLSIIHLDSLIPPSFTYICLNQRAHMKNYMYDFILLYAPHLDKNTIQRCEQWQEVDCSQAVLDNLPML
ncbi:LysR substrate-binding domain-containing protein [Xenorhabdus szentirmaii]|uniref:HTH-type transcriptional regulator CysB n=1 Tax=Xenorhabdus szentirmaii DSM 16338 TaxID=1427518 RepID=W1J4J3_9GAMM|nr:LysR substrate-binding domain-containing protein [Xenorhabdus szentirmaii]PHM34550.1 LysR family transcriptional regulator [Xenorhabdus szentirmaii DSM 16338]CDL84963.1 HTH-type transcriptional regulator CysB [Xenorhabdus szentirmaii DSM 16338]